MTRPIFEAPYQMARRIVCEEWGRAVKEFNLTPGSVTEHVVANIITRLDIAPWPASDAGHEPAGEDAASTREEA